VSPQIQHVCWLLGPSVLKIDDIEHENSYALWR
jgi:hypothetical protein